MYRWVSGASGITLSVPASLLPHPTGEGMDVDAGPGQPRARALCDVQNCGVVRKYRLVGNWERGACGMEHLKVLQQVS